MKSFVMATMLVFVTLSAHAEKLFEVEHILQTDSKGEPTVVLKRIVVVKEPTTTDIVAIIEKMTDEGIPPSARTAILEALTQPEYSVKTERWERKEPKVTPKVEQTRFEKIKSMLKM